MEGGEREGGGDTEGGDTEIGGDTDGVLKWVLMRIAAFCCSS